MADRAAVEGRVWESLAELDVVVTLAFEAAERQAVGGAMEWIEEEH